MTNVVEIQDQQPDLSGEDVAIRRLGNALHRLNDAVISAVREGLTVELVRTSRYHNEEGAWGDLMVPIIRATKDKD